MKNIKTFEGFSQGQEPPRWKLDQIDEIDVTIKGRPMLADVDFEIVQKGDIDFYKTRGGGFKAELSGMPEVRPFRATIYSLDDDNKVTLQGQELQALLSGEPGLEEAMLRRAEHDHQGLAEDAVNSIESTYEDGPFIPDDAAYYFGIPDHIRNLFSIGGYSPE